MRAIRSAVALLSAGLVLGGCEACAPPPAVLPSDGGDADGGGGKAPYGWPDASVMFEDSTGPSLAVTRGGTVWLTFDRGGKRWAVRDPSDGGAAMELGAIGSTRAPRMAASPTSEDVFHLWGATWVTWFTAQGGPQARTPLVSDPLNWEMIGYGVDWAGALPVAVLEANINNRITHYAVAAAGPGMTAPGPVPAGGKLDDAPLSMSYFNLTYTAIDLGDGGVLMVDPEPSTVPDSGTRAIHWRRLAPANPAAAGDAGYLVLAAEGLLPFSERPTEYRGWIQVHSFGPGRGALTFTEIAPGTAVFDVFLATLSVEADGGLELGPARVNVSNTGGMTDNSDFPLVKRTADGRLWVAWRESAFGPRVALYSADLNRRWVLAPGEDLGCNLTEPMAAAVGPDGALHLVAVVRPGTTDQVRYWVFPLP